MKRLLFGLPAPLLAAPLVAPAQSWRLVWSDEFNGPANSVPSTADWNFLRGWGPKGNHEIQFYCRPTDDGPCDSAHPNATPDGQGHLVIDVRRPGQLWSSARLNTQGKHVLLYGRVEARVRMEPGAGFWPAFWLLGEDIDKVGWPGCGEQDMSSGSRNTVQRPPVPPFTVPDTLVVKASAKPSPSPREAASTTANSTPTALTWSPDRMEFYRHDPAKPYFVVTPASLPPGTKWVYDHPFLVILNFAVGDGGFARLVSPAPPLHKGRTSMCGPCSSSQV
jgi:beta-glucanase (GH16 family)